MRTERAARAEWQLPTGVPQGNWDYAESPEIARDYDDYFAQHALLQLDQSIIDRHFRTTGTVVDLGCGTGRALMPLVRRGFQGIAVDLSQEMLREVRRKAKREGLEVQCVRANLVELDCLADDCVDDALCLFSTLGMVEGGENRLRVMEHVRRLVRPGGSVVLHVHNLWSSLWRADRGWLLRHYFRTLCTRRGRGDKRYLYRGIPGFYLHAFTWRELAKMFAEVGFRVEHRYSLAHQEGELLRQPWLANSLRAHGWIVVLR